MIEILIKEAPDTGVWIGSFPEFILIPMISFLIGFFLNWIIDSNSKKYLEILSALFLLAILIYVIMTISRPVLLETVFFLNTVRSVIGGFFLCLGILTAGFRDAQKGGFFLGIFIFAFVSLFFSFPLNNLKHIFLFVGFPFLINSILKNFIHLENQFLPRRSIKKEYPPFQGLYGSFYILFLIHSGISVYCNMGGLSLNVSLFLFSYISLRSFAIYRAHDVNYRQAFIQGRVILVISFILFAASFSWNVFGSAVFVLLGGALGFYKSASSSKSKKINNLMLGSIGLCSGIAIIYFSRTGSLIIHLEFLLAIAVFIPTNSSVLLNPISRHFPILATMLLSIFLFQYPSIKSKPTKLQTKPTLSSPYPYLLSNYFEETSKYIFIRSGLPFDNLDEFPDIEKLNSKIPVLGDYPDDRFLVYYSRYLYREKIPYIVVSNKFQINLDPNSFPMFYEGLEKKEYPGFLIYYTSNLETPDWNSSLAKNWKFTSIQSKLQDWNQPKEDFVSIGKELYKWENISSGEMKEEIRIYRNLFSESIKNFCDDYYAKAMHSEVLDCLLTSLEFGSLDAKSKEMAYESFSFSSPNLQRLPLLVHLSEETKYKIPIYKKLYPLYDSMENYSEVLKILDLLISQYKNSDDNYELEMLQIEKARIYIKMDKLEDAYSLIAPGLRNNPNSIFWKRLKDEWDAKRENKRRSWIPQAPVETKGI
ncbi:hypothetical protein [Leptospira sp. GIMC2001]|uniref:hypothetical protein n=1 Tax=Leptospira sp. GIMC2001 TaxID=1513297 RepID=UPI0023493020|nr:hypothetical protein [Leptospira sp. GIMC2001]WCL48751.1 hypothetical protein O4O04_15795 [Leptospira sp. GIMC2001]